VGHDCAHPGFAIMVGDTAGEPLVVFVAGGGCWAADGVPLKRANGPGMRASSDFLASAPAAVVASLTRADKSVRTRPLCPYPQVARYKGQGSIDDAENFRCVAPK
jgi:hypothetical protein